MPFRAQNWRIRAGTPHETRRHRDHRRRPSRLDRGRHARLRRNYDVLIDPHKVYPSIGSTSAAKKISGDGQLDRVDQTGNADSVLRSATHGGENWVARFGRDPGRNPAARRTRLRQGARIRPPHSLLVIILVVVIVLVVVVVVVGVMLPVALVVPELAIDPVDGEQLRMRAALDRLAA